MRFLACAALLLACSLPALADTYVYVSVAGEKKIAVYHLDTEQGTLAHRAVSGTFAGAEEEDPARLQPEVEQRQHFLLGAGLEVDEQVAAGDQVELGERGVLEDVVRREHHHLAQLLRHLVHIALAGEVARQPLRAHVGKAGLRVQGGAGEFQRGAVHVGREDLDRDILPQSVKALADKDGHRVGLFPGGAPGHPDAKLLLLLRCLLEQGG